MYADTSPIELVGTLASVIQNYHSSPQPRRMSIKWPPREVPLQFDLIISKNTHTNLTTVLQTHRLQVDVGSNNNQQQSQRKHFLVAQTTKPLSVKHPSHRAQNHLNKA